MADDVKKKEPAKAATVTMLSMRAGDVILSRDALGKPSRVISKDDVVEVSEDEAEWLEKSFLTAGKPEFKRIKKA